MSGRLTSTGVPLAALHDVALLDLDGVVYVGPDAVPNAAESLDRALAEHGMRAGFVTNNASRPPGVVAEHLRELGVHADAADVVTSAQAGARVLAELLAPGSNVLAVGGPGVAWALDERGLVPVTSADDDPVAVIQGFGPDVGWRALAEASLVIQRGLPWVATNRDRTIPSPRGRVLGNGAMVEALRHATDVDPIVAGKPEPPLMVESVERMRATRPIVVGDRLDTDIEGAVRSGIASLLVLTGVTDWHDLLGAPADLRPTYLGYDLRALLEPAPEVRVEVARDVVRARCGSAGVDVPVGDGVVGDRMAIAGSTGARFGTDWLPARCRDLSPVPGVPDGAAPALDLIRALVAASWAMQDEELVPRAAAVVHPT